MFLQQSEKTFVGLIKRIIIIKVSTRIHTLNILRIRSMTDKREAIKKEIR